MARSFDLDKIAASFAQLASESPKIFQNMGIPSPVATRMERAIVYTSNTRRFARALTLLNFGRELAGRELTQQEVADLHSLSWLVEVYSGSAIISDDLMDNSTNRRGRPCWHLLPETGQRATNDASLLRSAVFILLNHLFGHLPCYGGLLDSFLTNSFFLDAGQDYDAWLSNENFSTSWTHEQCERLGIIKSGWVLTLPALLALHYFGLGAEINVTQTTEILDPLGRLYQVRNDYDDIFGHLEEVGRVGTDIQENKCSWAIVEALRICNEEQRQELQQNVGKGDKDSAAKAQEFIRSLPITARFQEEERSCVAQLRGKVEEIDDSQGLKKSALYSVISCYLREFL
ncbi:hypothetical protein HIM_08946 [Hirsutella minnesotensis 3608]|uniref:Uncharacterized protein n=1 Tax=Hirsutella minnesotensis 3608 TaxID=1043627 RepID=A0A0F8A3D4_9HYPO|nr:hypothetical protein HIM_08946 [Hirsutella minnesotensis 3608]